MSRLLALASTALLALALPAAAAPVVFQASASGTSIELNCGTAAAPCTRLKADLLFDDNANSVSGVVNPELNFGLIVFDGLEADDDDDDEKYGKDDKKYGKDDKKKLFGEKKSSKDNKKQPENDLFSDSFGITATLAFSILNLPEIFTVVAKGEGNFSVDEEDLKSLTLAWQPIEDLFIEGVGTFAFSFSNIGVANASRLFAPLALTEDNEQEDPNEDGIDLRVAATVTQVSVVPLPAGGLLLLSAFGILALSARQRRRALAA